MKKLIALILLSIFTHFSLHADNENMFKYEFLDNNNAEISILTCGPGNELYSVFGHNGVRIKDTKLNIDAVFNFGTFQFDEDFYKNYIMGRLNYCLSYSSYQDFMYSYNLEGRSVSEIKLNLNNIQKQAFFQHLRRTYKGQERCYLYDFLYNNCATKIRDYTDNTVHKYQNVPGINYERESFRTILHQHLNYFPWSGLGIDILLGSPIDIKPDYREQAFLPSRLEKYYLNKTINNDTYVINEPITLLTDKVERPGLIRFIYHPVTILWVIFGFLLVLLIKNPNNSKVAKINNSVLFILGLLGVFLCFMWFGTDHNATKGNYNLIWANPLFLLFALNFKNNLLKYLGALFIFTGGLLSLLDVVLPQTFNIALIPVFLWLFLLGLRRFFTK